MMYFVFTFLLCLVFAPVSAQWTDAPAGFDNRSNGMVDEATHLADLETFNAVEDIADGLGPLYNAQSCRECHQNPVSGAASQVSELRVGHMENGQFVNPSVPITGDVITGRSLINDRAICPEAQERVPVTEDIRTFRMSLNILGDGFVEAV